MTRDLLEASLILAFVFFLFWKYWRGKRKSIGISGKLIWVDKGRKTKPFFSQQYRIVGKPDLMYQRWNGVLSVEYKSRRGPVFNSDVVQAKCAALAARGSGIKVKQILIKTDSVEKYIDLPKGDKELHRDIRLYIETARTAKSGAKMEASPSANKCRSCAYKNACKNAAI